MAGIRDKFQRLIKPPDDEYEDYYGEEEQDDSYEEPKRSSFSSFRSEPRDSRVVELNQGVRSRSQMQMVVRRPTTFGEEISEIADELLNRHTVVLNLEKADKESERRIVDFLSGVAYANHGRLKPIAAHIVIVTPYNVDLTGDDVLDELESSGIYF